LSETVATPERPSDGRQLVLITGLSGSGKSTVAKSFEDLGYYCVDNLPLGLLRTFLADPFAHVEGRERIAVVADVRAAGFSRELPELLQRLSAVSYPLVVLFLESSDEALVRRFSETRRPHPLAAGATALEGIQRERQLLADLRGRADLVFDTSAWSIHEIRGHVYREFAEREKGGSLSIRLVSFGFKFGIPYGSDLLFDVRFLPNPHFVAELREKTGKDAEVMAYLEEHEDFAELTGRLQDLLLYLLPRYRDERRSYLSVAIGCTGGKHRSVAVCERLASALDAAGWQARVAHRDIER
jgi:UPF0042 nucleotide-binding protein